ncbi:MAG: TonB-dependent receptor [Acidobacteria bacterium]|nr:TonB-dependent receptor [Acidobacteriota bacterium]
MPWPLALTLALLVPGPLMAQETTGAIEGVVRDTSGAVLPGATVNTVGPPGTISTVADARGEFRFPRLPSGRYKITAVLAGFNAGEGNVDLTVGSTSRVDFALALGGLAETIEVTSSTPAIDLTTAMTATNISRERISLVPRGRNFTDVVGQAAGAADESQAGGISIDGSSGSENRFVIDGIDTTSPQVGTNAMPLRAELVEEVQVKSAGYSAEFGGSTGGVINVITRSGTNAWRGGLMADFEQRSWGGSERRLLRESLTGNDFTYINPPKDDESRIDPGFFLGGPVLRDHVWFFGSYVPGIRDTKRTVTFTNGTTDTFPQDFRVHYGTFNVTGNAGSKLLYRAGANFSPYETTGTLPPQDGRTSLSSPGDYQRGSKGDRSTYSGSVDYLPLSNLVISGRVGRFRTDVESTGVQFPGLIHNFSTASTPAGIAALPDQFRRSVGFLSDILVTDATATDEYRRNYVGVDATWYLSAFGEHQIKGGFQTERIFNNVQRGYNADRILYYAGRPYAIAATGQQVQGTFGYFRLLNISTLGKVSSPNDALFVQDTWRATSRLTLNLGLRAEHERVPNFGERGVKNPIEFGYGEKLAPRLGFAYDPLGNQQWKLYGSFGKYYDVMKYELPRGSFGGDKWVDYFYTWDSPNWQANSTSGCATGTNTASVRPTCPAGTFIEALDRRHNSAEDPDEGIDPNLKPMEENEFQLGLNRELRPGIVVGARYVFKDLVRTIEDVGILVCDAPGSCGEVFYIANPGEGISLTLNDPGVPAFPKATREYQGLELTFERRYAQNWALFGSYTFSRLYGNYSGLASSDENGRTSPNVNRFFDHLENSFDRNGQPVLGRLGTDRPHQFKAQFIYGFNWNMTMGLNQYVASGIPVSEEANVGANVPFFPYGRGNLGRTDVLSRTDLSLYQSVRFANLDLRLGMTVLNLFDQDAVTRRFRNRMVGSLPLNTDRFFQGGWDYEALLAANPRLTEVRFNQPDEFQEPRQVRFNLTLQF